MRVLYHSPTDLAEFDLDRYYKSLNKYGSVSKEAIEQKLATLKYDPMHYSVLVEIGVELLPSDESAKKYYDEHEIVGQNFERLRRITGYLVGSLERWNDGKKAEERERVKHGVYTQEQKVEREIKKREQVLDSQDEYRKGTCY